MSWRFRKYLNFGLFRIGVSKNGLGFSFGIPGFRYGISSSGKKTLSIGLPDTGLYWSKSLEDDSKKISVDDPASLTDNQIILAKIKEKQNKT